MASIAIRRTDELTEMGFPLPATAARWRLADLDWLWVGDRRMYVVGYTSGGAPFGCYEDELDDEP